MNQRLRWSPPDVVYTPIDVTSGGATHKVGLWSAAPPCIIRAVVSNPDNQESEDAHHRATLPREVRGSRDWHERGKSLFAGGITHQTRFTSPFPVYIEHAEGPYKYDVDGNQIIDYVMGNGSLLMGHSPPGVTEAVIAAA